MRGLLEKMWSRLGAYLRAKIIVMAIVGALMYVALLLIGVPFALVLSIIVALGEVIPRAGPWLARIPLLGIAALEGWKTFLIVFAVSVVIENAKGYFISPYVEGDQLDIHPLLVFVSVLVGATLGGFAGAFVAVPLAAIVDLFVREVLVPWRKRRWRRRPPDGAPRRLRRRGHSAALDRERPRPAKRGGQGRGPGDRARLVGGQAGRRADRRSRRRALPLVDEAPATRLASAGPANARQAE